MFCSAALVLHQVQTPRRASLQLPQATSLGPEHHFSIRFISRSHAKPSLKVLLSTPSRSIKNCCVHTLHRLCFEKQTCSPVICCRPNISMIGKSWFLSAHQTLALFTHNDLMQCNRVQQKNIRPMVPGAYVVEEL